jgi:hypothetical protein
VLVLGLEDVRDGRDVVVAEVELPERSERAQHDQIRVQVKDPVDVREELGQEDPVPGGLAREVARGQPLEPLVGDADEVHAAALALDHRCHALASPARELRPVEVVDAHLVLAIRREDGMQHRGGVRDVRRALGGARDVEPAHGRRPTTA